MSAAATKDRSRYLSAKTVKGKPYLYFRMVDVIERDGRVIKKERFIALPSDQSTAEFRRCYDACIKAIQPATAQPVAATVIDADTAHVAFIGGTIGAAITKYKSSSEFTGNRLSTQRKYITTIDVMRNRIGGLAFAGFDVDAVDIYSEQLVRDFSPSVARNHVWMLSILFRVCRKYPEFGLKGKANPTDGAVQRYSVKKPRPAWKPEAQDLFYQTAPRHLQDAFTLLRYGAQRGGDCTKMMLSDFDGESLMVVPEKQGTERGEPNFVPCVKPLRDLLNRLIKERGKDAPILLNAKGKPWATTSDISEAIRDHLIKIGLAKTGTRTISMHGLRGNAASEVAELLLGTAAIKVVGGWKSNEMAEYYARNAEKLAMGKKVRVQWDELIEEKAAARVRTKRANLRSVK